MSHAKLVLTFGLLALSAGIMPSAAAAAFRRCGHKVCRHQAADLIVLGLHETGGIDRFRKAAAIAQAAGIDICLHGLYETGITTCASNQIGSTLLNLDDGNQYMNHLLIEDIVESPNLTLKCGQLPVVSGPGLGFELNWDAVGRAEESHRVCSAK